MSNKDQSERKPKRWTAKAKSEVVLEGLRGEKTVAELCRRHGITQSMYYEWKERFLKAGLEGLAYGGKTAKEKALEKELREAQRSLGRATLEIELLKKKRDIIEQRQKRQ